MIWMDGWMDGWMDDPHRAIDEEKDSGHVLWWAIHA
jgi:hypothetical protein